MQRIGHFYFALTLAPVHLRQYRTGSFRICETPASSTVTSLLFSAISDCGKIQSAVPCRAFNLDNHTNLGFVNGSFTAGVNGLNSKSTFGTIISPRIRASFNFGMKSVSNEYPGKLEGVYPILLTTFHDDGSLDLESQRRLIHHLLEEGAHGLGLFGNASEGYALSGSERRQLLASFREVNGRVPLVASSGHTGTHVAVELSRESEDLGADALMVLPPYYLKTDGDGLVRYYGEIANAIKIPIMVQDAPALTAVAMPPSLLARMAREIPACAT